jgi:hypothetical protein
MHIAKNSFCKELSQMKGCTQIEWMNIRKIQRRRFAEGQNLIQMLDLRGLHSLKNSSCPKSRPKQELKSTELSIREMHILQFSEV